jgi:hypothetical protein
MYDTPLMNALWLRCTNSSSRGASWLANTFDSSLPIMCINVIGLKSLMEAASGDLGSRINRAWLMAWRLLMSMCLSASKTLIRFGRMMCHATCKKRTVKASGPGALSSESERITDHTSSLVNHSLSSKRVRHRRSRRSILMEFARVAGVPRTLRK